MAGHDIVVNCAGYTAVDDAETHEAEAFAVNAVGAANLARAAHGHGARMVHVSTDYVFAGDAQEPYAEDAPLAPRSAYGRTKAAGEWAVEAHCPESWVVRTAWLYGAGGGNFVTTMARLAGERETVAVVDDQRGQPTWTVDLADAIVRLVTSNAPCGVWHGTSSGRDDLVRSRPGDLPAAGPGPGPGRADDHRRLPTAGAPAGIQRVGSRGVADGVARAAPGLAGVPGPGPAGSRHSLRPAGSGCWALAGRAGRRKGRAHVDTPVQDQQEALWAGEFGAEYIQRNRGASLIASNTELFRKVLARTEGVSSVLELGCNIGNNLRALRDLLPDADLHGVEINEQAAEEVRRWGGASVEVALLDLSSDPRTT